MGRKKKCYRVVIKIQEIEYDSQIGSYRPIRVSEPDGPYQDWGMGDYETLKKAEDVVRGMTRSER